MTERYQVIIVGGGPVGVALAVDLGLRGVSCALIERHHEPQRIPKGQNLTARTLEHFYFWGIEEEMRRARVMPPGYPIGNVTVYGTLMGDYWYAPRGHEVTNRFFFTRNERLPQYLTEGVLRGRLATLPSVTALFGKTAKQVEQDDRGVRVTVADDGWPYEETALEAEYVVGCDGARSLVRDRLGIGLDGPEYDRRMVLAVLRSPDLHEGLKRFTPATTYRVLNPELQGLWQFFGRIDVGETFFFHAPVPHDATRETFDAIGLLREAAGFELQATLDRVGFWDFRIQVAREYRNGRGFIAGDACHSHPPYGGFGLNAGLEDAVNLGWKLAAALDGWGGDRLLDSYGQERRPIFLDIGISTIAGGIAEDRAFLEGYSPTTDRAAFERAWNALAERNIWQGSFEPHYEGSPVVLGPDGAACSIYGRHTYAAQAGHHLAPQPLSTGRNVFEALGPGFTLLAFGADDGAVRAFEDAARSLRVPMTVLRDSLAGERQAYEAQLVLVRPDQYVVWAGQDAPADARAIVRTATGIA